MYIKLVTLISVKVSKEEDEVSRESLTSLHTLFKTIRKILKKYGPEIAIPTRKRISF